MTDSHVPVVDLRGDPMTVALEIDAALHEVGFLLVSGHGVDPDLMTTARTLMRTFFHLPPSDKSDIAIDDAAYRGWVPSGAETNVRAYGLDGPPDLKESFIAGPQGRPDDDYHRAEPRWFAPNRWPGQVPGLEVVWLELQDAFEDLAMRLLTLAELAIDVAPGTFTDGCHRGIGSMVANFYLALGGRDPGPDHYRIGPHTDYGGLTVLDREPGAGGLQVQLLDDTWVDAPYVPGTLTINTGDLISLWTDGRWRSTRHRVLAPPTSAPDEELISLVYFQDPDHDTPVTPLGRGDVEPVLAGDYLAAKIAQLTGS